MGQRKDVEEWWDKERTWKSDRTKKGRGRVVGQRKDVEEWWDRERTWKSGGTKKGRGRVVGQRKDVEEWCRQCKVCTSRKSPSTHPKAPMQTYTSANPMDRVAMDILGPLPVTPRGNRYILTIADYYTKWTEAYPMQDMEASTVANCRFGAPVYLHTDQGRNLSPN